MVCSQKLVRNRNFFENAGHISFSFCQTGSAETHTKPYETSPQGMLIKRPAIYWDHAVSWGEGGWVSVSDIGRVGKKMVLRRIPIYFLSTTLMGTKNLCENGPNPFFFIRDQKFGQADSYGNGKLIRKWTKSTGLGAF